MTHTSLMNRNSVPRTYSNELLQSFRGLCGSGKTSGMSIEELLEQRRPEHIRRASTFQSVKFDFTFRKAGFRPQT